MAITVKVCLTDAMGRAVEVEAPIDIHEIGIGVGPIGCLMFDRTEEKTPITFARIYRQRVGMAPVAPVAPILQ